MTYGRFPCSIVDKMRTIFTILTALCLAATSAFAVSPPTIFHVSSQSIVVSAPTVKSNGRTVSAITFDSDFVKITKTSLMNAAKQFNRWVESNDYVEQSFDCDNYTRLFAQLTKVAAKSKRSYDAEKGELLVGTAVIRNLKEQFYHAVVIADTTDGLYIYDATWAQDPIPFEDYEHKDHINLIIW